MKILLFYTPLYKALVLVVPFPEFLKFPKFYFLVILTSYEHKTVHNLAIFIRLGDGIVL